MFCLPILFTVNLFNRSKRTDRSRVSSDLSNENGQHRLVNGALVLGIAVLICKVIGMIYKIPLMSIIGLEGMSSFSASYQIYNAVLSIATSGLPVALSVMISASIASGDRKKSVYGIFKTARLAFSAVGIVAAILLVIFSGVLESIIRIPDTRYSIMAIAPALLFLSVSSALKGYFQGHENMRPTAVSQVIESSGKLVFGIIFSLVAVELGVRVGIRSVGAALGISAGALVSMCYLIVEKKKASRHAELENIPTIRGGKSILSELTALALPVTLASGIVGITNLFDTLFMTDRLISLGYALEPAQSIYSAYSNMAISLFNLPVALIGPISLALVPVLTNALTLSDRDSAASTVNGALKLCLIFSIPAALGLSVFSKPILSLVFRNEALGVSLAAPLLSVLALSVPFAGLISVTNAILHASKKVEYTVISVLAAAIVKCISELILMSMPDVAAYGAPISTLLCDITVVSLNMYFIFGRTLKDIRPRFFEMLAKPLIATAASLLVSVCVYKLLSTVSNTLQILAAIALTAVIYCVLLILLGGVTYDDMRVIPHGEKIAEFLKIKKK